MPRQDDEEEDEEMADYVIKTQVREVFLLKKLKHPNIISLIEDFEEADGMYLVFEYMPENCLNALERITAAKLKADTIRSLARQLIEAVAFCHKHRVVSYAFGWLQASTELSWPHFLVKPLVKLSHL